MFGTDLLAVTIFRLKIRKGHIVKFFAAVCIVSLMLIGCAPKNNDISGLQTRPESLDSKIFSVTPNEKTRYLQFDESPNGPINIRQVDSVAVSDKTITLVFREDAKAGMILKIYNPAKRPLKFDLGMQLPDGRTVKTSSCPVRPGLYSYESWPHPIVTLYMKDFRWVDESYTKCD